MDIKRFPAGYFVSKNNVVTILVVEEYIFLQIDFRPFNIIISESFDKLVRKEDFLEIKYETDKNFPIEDNQEQLERERIEKEIEKYLLFHVWILKERSEMPGFAWYYERENSYIYEWCANCTLDQKLLNKVEVQKCPNCGALLLPCALCNHNEVECSKCPLLKEKRVSEYNFKNSFERKELNSY